MSEFFSSLKIEINDYYKCKTYKQSWQLKDSNQNDTGFRYRRDTPSVCSFLFFYERFHLFFGCFPLSLE